MKTERVFKIKWETMRRSGLAFVKAANEYEAMGLVVAKYGESQNGQPLMIKLADVHDISPFQLTKATKEDLENDF